MDSWRKTEQAYWDFIHRQNYKCFLQIVGQTMEKQQKKSRIGFIFSFIWFIFLPPKHTKPASILTPLVTLLLLTQSLPFVKPSLLNLWAAAQYVTKLKIIQGCFIVTTLPHSYKHRTHKPITNTKSQTPLVKSQQSRASSVLAFLTPATYHQESTHCQDYYMAPSGALSERRAGMNLTPDSFLSGSIYSLWAQNLNGMGVSLLLPLQTCFWPFSWPFLHHLAWN